MQRLSSLSLFFFIWCVLANMQNKNMVNILHAHAHRCTILSRHFAIMQ